MERYINITFKIDNSIGNESNFEALMMRLVKNKEPFILNPEILKFGRTEELTLTPDDSYMFKTLFEIAQMKRGIKCEVLSIATVNEQAKTLKDINGKLEEVTKTLDKFNDLLFNGISEGSMAIEDFMEEKVGDPAEQPEEKKSEDKAPESVTVQIPDIKPDEPTVAKAEEVKVEIPEDVKEESAENTDTEDYNVSVPATKNETKPTIAMVGGNGNNIRKAMADAIENNTDIPAVEITEQKPQTTEELIKTIQSSAPTSETPDYSSELEPMPVKNKQANNSPLANTLSDLKNGVMPVGNGNAVDISSGEIMEIDPDEGIEDIGDDIDGYDSFDGYTEFSDDDLAGLEKEPIEYEDEMAKAPNGKLYDDTYTFIKGCTRSFLDKFSDKEALQERIETLVIQECGYVKKLEKTAEEAYARLQRKYNSYSLFVDKYPQMEKIDNAKFWAESYEKLFDKVSPYDDMNNPLLSGDGILDFDSFVRAKLNRDIPCEAAIKEKIDGLYN